MGRGGGSRGGYDNNDRGGFDSFRRGGSSYDRDTPSASSGGMRPKLQLKSRTAPLAEPPKPVEKKEPVEEPKVEEKVEAPKEETPAPAKTETPAPAKVEEPAPAETPAAEDAGGDGWETVEGVKGKSKE